MVSQLLLLREFLSQFQGNEFTLSLILAFWLLAGGIGTWFANLAAGRERLSHLAAVSMVLALSYPFTILLVRLVRNTFFIPGVDVGFYPTLACIGGLSLCCGLLVGFVLPYSLGLLRKDNPEYPGARIYLLDNIGDVSGGALFSFLLVSLTTPVVASCLVALLLLVTAWLALPGQRRYHLRWLLGMAMGLAGLGWGLTLERPSLAPFEGTLVHYRESRYGRITVTGQRELFTMFLDGSPLYSTQNRYLAEMTVHYPLSQLDRVERVLLIGGRAGMVKELRKYGSPTIDYIEIDPEVTRAQFAFGFLEKWDRVHLLHEDGRRFLMRSEQKYDAIIISLSEPDTFQVNRFYTDEFFRIVREHLQPAGILSFSVEGYDNYLATPQQQKLSSLYRTAIRHFHHVLPIPGNTVFFLCSQNELATDIPERLAAKHVDSRFVANLYHGNVTPMRLRYLQSHLKRDVPVNTDFSPFLIRVMFDQWFARFDSSPIPFFLVSALLCLVYLVRSKGEELVLFSTGFVTMGTESLLLLVYQIIHGYVYVQMGILVTIFLLGLLPGASLGQWLRRRGKAGGVRNRLLHIDTMIFVLVLAFTWALALGYLHASGLWIYLFGFGLSMLCGCQFPLALAMGGDDSGAAVRSFSADLIGAAAGTLVTSLVFVPYFGIIPALLGLALVKAAGSLVLFRSRSIPCQTVIP